MVRSSFPNSLVILVALFGIQACAQRGESGSPHKEAATQRAPANDQNRVTLKPDKIDSASAEPRTPDSPSNLQKLLVAEYRNPKVGDYTYLVSYNFKDGVFLSKDTLFEAPTSKRQGKFNVSYVSFSGGGSLYRNRYVIAGNGAVIDTRTRKLVGEHADPFVEALGDTLIFYRQASVLGEGYLALDLKTGNYDFIENDVGYRPPLTGAGISPDGKSYLIVDKRDSPYKIYLKNMAGHDGMEGNGTLLIEDGGERLAHYIQDIGSHRETHWLTNHTFLYAKPQKFKKADNHYDYKVAIHQYNLLDKLDQVFFTIDLTNPAVVNGRFYEDGIGQTIYQTGREYYVLDTLENTMHEYTDHQLGCEFAFKGFSTNLGSTKTILMYKGDAIGELFCGTPTVGEGVIAVRYGGQGSNLEYPKGLKIWTTQTGEWSTFDVPWISAIIGWQEAYRND